jgi:hypothetical protein
MDPDDPLLVPRETTCLWETSSGDATAFRASLEEVEDAYANSQDEAHQLSLLQLDDPESTGRIVSDPESKVVELTLIKRNAGYDVAVDGLAPSATDRIASRASYMEPAMTTVKIHSHTGLHHDYRTGTSILSPCCVSVLLEDGQRAPERVTVAVVHRFTTSAGMDAFGRPVVVGQAELPPTRVDDPILNGVVVPYPTGFSRMPVVAIYDRRPVEKDFMKNTGQYIWAVVPKLASAITMEFFTMLEAPTSFSFAVQSFADNSIGALFISMLPLVAMLGGFTTFAVALTGTVTKIFELNNAQASQIGTVPNILFGLLFEGFKSIAGRSYKPKALEMRLTPAELASTLRSIATIAPMADDDVRNMAKDIYKMRKELTTWAWLLHEEQATIVERTINLGYADRNIRFGSNPLDLDNFVVGLGSSIVTFIRVVVEDSEYCADDGNFAQTFEFVCGRDDKERAKLGALAMGLLKDLKDLNNVIVEFKVSLQKTLAEKNETFDQRTFAWRWFFMNVRETLNLFRDSKASKATRNALRMCHKKSIQTVLNNLDIKLERYFLYPGSAGQRMIEALEGMLTSKVPRLFATGSDYLLRRMSHVAFKASALLPTGISSSHVDYDIFNTPVRVTGDIGDSMDGLNLSMKISRIAFAGCLKSWQSVGNRPRLSFLYKLSVHKDALNDMKKRRPMPSKHRDSYILVFQYPADVQSEAISRRYKELDRCRIDLITRTSAKHTNEIFYGLGIPNTVAHSSAIHILSELCVYESMELWNNEFTAQQEAFDLRRLVWCTTTALAPVLERASRRALRVATLLRSLFSATFKGPIDLQDVAMQATEGGTDLLRFVRHMRFSTLSGDVLVEYTQRIAAAIEQTVRAVFGKNNLVYKMPSEPLASLISMPAHRSQAAYERVARVLMLPSGEVQVTNALLNIEASYPLLALEKSTTLHDALRVPATTVHEPLPPSKPSVKNDAFLGSIKIRAMRLQVTHTKTGLPALHNPDILEIVNKLLDAVPRHKPIEYYVPFGYGDPSPMLTFPASPAVMFASVPVWTSHVVDALRGIRTACKRQSRTNDPKQQITLEPRFAPRVSWHPVGSTETRDDVTEHLSNTDAVDTQTSTSGPGSTSEADSLEGVDTREATSSSEVEENTKEAKVELRNDLVERDPYAFRKRPEIIELRDRSKLYFLASASDTRLNAGSSKPLVPKDNDDADLADVVSSMVWNSERVLQCSCLAAAHDYKTMKVSIPNTDGYRNRSNTNVEVDDSKVATDLSNVFKSFIKTHYATFRTTITATRAKIDVALDKIYRDMTDVQNSDNPTITSTQLLQQDFLDSVVLTGTDEPVRTTNDTAGQAQSQVQLDTDNQSDEDAEALLKKGSMWITHLTTSKDLDTFYGDRVDVPENKWFQEFGDIENAIWYTWYTDDMENIAKKVEELTKTDLDVRTKQLSDEFDKIRIASVEQTEEGQALRKLYSSAARIKTKLLTLASRQEQDVRTSLPVWSSASRKTFVLALVIGQAMSAAVLHDSSIVVDDIEWSNDKEKDAIVKGLDMCISTLSVDAKNFPNASMRLGEMCASLHELVSRV